MWRDPSSFHVIVTTFVLREWLCPGIAEIIYIFLYGAHREPVTGEYVGPEIEIVADQLARNSAPSTQVRNYFAGHVEIQATFIRAQSDMYDPVTITRRRHVISVNLRTTDSHGAAKSVEWVIHLVPRRAACAL